MSDKDLRESVRDASTGAPEAAARLLKERLRAGTLTQDRLEVAAYCGHEPAGLLLDDAREIPGGGRAWFAGLARFGHQAWLKGVVVCLEHWIPHMEGELEDPDIPPFTVADAQAAGRRVIAAAKTYADCPCLEHANLGKASMSVPLVHNGDGIVSRIFDYPWEPKLDGVTLLDGPESATRPLAEALTRAGAVVRHVGSDDSAKVILEGGGRRRIQVIKEIRRALGVSLVEAKLLSEEPSRHLEPFHLARSTAALREDLADAVCSWALA